MSNNFKNILPLYQNEENKMISKFQFFPLTFVWFYIPVNLLQILNSVLALSLKKDG